ncbi:ganglioside GM2 activator-like isoform X2 [Haliotis rufescens]|uniref:ganglioside GM2 activator-like isoform X2 n=1 Tax=Haliotis rufescens TaxID=6454 RepID=UPI00201E9EA2|nr:ganglioside GM2 activator-like isoform X2 [Haliotis rufescens]
MKAFTVFVLLCVVSGAHSSSRDESCSNHDKAMDDALKTVCAKTCMRWSVVNSYDMTDGIGQVLNSATHNRCGSSEGIVTINELQIDPSPLVLPGNINLAFKVNVKRDLQSPIKVEVTVWKSILIWIHVKDFAFEDVCEFLTDGKCPQSFIDNNIPCSCPIPEGEYNFPSSKFPLKASSIPGGDYSVRFNVNMGPTLVLCEDVYFTVA